MRQRHPAPLRRAGPSLSVAGTVTRRSDMFTGLKRSIAIIVALLTIVPWGVMQLVY